MKKDDLLVMLCCNDPDSGNFAGQLWGIEFGHGLKLSSSFFDWAPKLVIGKDWIRVARKKFSIRGHRSWYGNWCWEAVWMDWKEAIGLANFLKSKKIRRRSKVDRPTVEEPWFACDEAEQRLYNLWHSEGRFTLNDARIMAKS